MNNIVKIVELKKFLSNTLENINNKISKRDGIITFKDVIYITSLRLINNIGYQTANCCLELYNNIKVTKTALINKKNNIKLSYFEHLNNELLNFIYKNEDKPRFIAVDGSTIITYLNLSNDNKKNNDEKHFKKSKDGNYSSGLVSCLFDTEKKIPINYTAFNHANERDALLNQLSYLKKNDTLIMDRGYFSDNLMDTLLNNDLNVIFRMKKNHSIIQKNLNSNDDVMVEYKGKHLRLLKYKINKEDYFLLTNLTTNNLDYFKQLYKNRWGVETEFNYLKHYLSFSQNKSRSILSLTQDLMVNNFIQILDGFIRNEIETKINNDNIKNNKNKINKKNSLYFLSTELLRMFFYEKNTKKTFNKISKVLQIIGKTTTEIKENRHNQRIKKSPVSKWNLITIKLFYKNKKKS